MTELVSRQDIILEAIWLEALEAPIGLLIRTSDPERCRQRLYASRKKLGLPALDALQIRISPIADGELVIVRSSEGASL